MTEDWKDVRRFEGFYLVSNKGRVKSVSKTVRIGDHTRFIPGRMMKLRRTPRGYYTVKLSKFGKSEICGVHWLVLEAFVCPRPQGLFCRHLDGNPSNNFLANLAWGTAKQNTEDAIRHGTFPRGEKNGRAKIADVEIQNIHTLYKSGKTVNQIGKIYGVTGGAIKFILHGETYKQSQPSEPAVVRPSGFQRNNRAKGKLTDELRIGIRLRRESGLSYNQLVQEFGVSYTTIWNFLNGRTYT